MKSTSVQKTARIAAEFAASLRARRAGPLGFLGLGKGGATVVALSGDLGSGKTTFVKHLAAAYGVPQDDVTSPTFIIMKSYDVSASPAAARSGFKRLIHIDAYRLDSPDQAAHIGWSALVADPANLILVEWPEKLGERMLKSARRIEFRFVDDATREISLL